MKKEQKNNKGTSPTEMGLLEVFTLKQAPVSVDELLRLSGLPKKEKRKIEKILRELAGKGRVLRLRGGRWTRTETLKEVTGSFQALPKGGGFVLAHDGDSDIFIPAAHVGGAWHDDMVRAIVEPLERGAKKGEKCSREGRIVEILQRNLREIPVVVKKRLGRNLLCKPCDARLAMNFSVKIPAGFRHAEPGKSELLLVRPVEKKDPELWSASFVRLLGQENTVAAQEEIVKITQQVPMDFPALALEQAERLPSEPADRDMKNRADVCHIPFITIDGADARDFDDAIHVEKNASGWLLRVAIADVSHYIRPDGHKGSLDTTARERGNSWYFPASVEPMLPKALSNGLCSLAPAQKRLAVMVELPVDETGKQGRPVFSTVVMCSCGRLTYDLAESYLAAPDRKSWIAETGAGHDRRIWPMLDDAFDLYRALREQRKKRGALDFDLPEPQYVFDGNKNLAAIKFAGRGDANRLIEEFMIATNEAVADWLEREGKPVLYRVHPEPDAAKIEKLFATLKACAPECLPAGVWRAPLSPASIQEILARASGSQQEYVVNRLCLRAMTQARYQPQNTGHFGLASRAYCHFTSPIRRYADLLVHRALKRALGDESQILPSVQELHEIAENLNVLERRAVECEREIAKRLGCLLLAGREGEVFECVISGVTDFGVFIELAEMPLEGLIRIESLGEDWYEFDPDTLSLAGMRSGAIFRLGQKLRAVLRQIDMKRMELRFAPLESRARRGQKAARAKGQRRNALSRPEKSRGGRKHDTETKRKKTAGKQALRSASAQKKTSRKDG